MMNMFWERLTFEVPTAPGREWHLAVDTFAASPGDLHELGRGPAVNGGSCPVEARSIVVLVSAEAATIA